MNFYNAIVKQCASEISKTRTTILVGKEKWEIDEFHHSALGNLVLAEIELEREDQKVKLPSWVGKEVTSDPAFKNAVMAKKLTNHEGSGPQRRK